MQLFATFDPKVESLNISIYCVSVSLDLLLNLNHFRAIIREKLASTENKGMHRTNIEASVIGGGITLTTYL